MQALLRHLDQVLKAVGTGCWQGNSSSDLHFRRWKQEHEGDNGFWAEEGHVNADRLPPVPMSPHRGELRPPRAPQGGDSLASGQERLRGRRPILPEAASGSTFPPVPPLILRELLTPRLLMSRASYRDPGGRERMWQGVQSRSEPTEL